MSNRGLTFPAEPLSAAEVRALLAAIDGTTLAGARNYALLVLLWRTGLRCSEALALRPSDINFDAGTVRVLRGKGRKARTVGIDHQAAGVVRAWLGVREAAGIDSPVLFCAVVPGRVGLPVSARYVRMLTARLAERAGVQHRVNPHSLRHTHATELSREGWSVPLISRQLGHASIAVTDVYLNHLYPAEVVDKAHERVWA